MLVPLRKYSFWYLLVANFRDKRFEVICPFKNIDIIQSDAFNVICKFRKVFKAVHSKSSRLDIYDMPTVFGSVSNQINQLSFLIPSHPTSLVYFSVLYITRIFFYQQWQRCLCFKTSFILRWQNTFPLQRG